MKAKNIVQQLVIALSLGVAASAHAQLLGGGGLGGSVGGMIGGGMGRMGGIDASGMVRGSGRLDADIARPAREAATRTVERVREVRPEPPMPAAGRGAASTDGQAGGAAALELGASGAASLAGQDAAASGSAAVRSGAQAAGQRTAQAADRTRTGLESGAELARSGTASLKQAAPGSGSASGSGSVEKSAPGHSGASASLSLGASASAQGRTGAAQ